MHMPRDTSYETGWAMHRIPQNDFLEHLCYHADSGLYVACGNEPSNFHLPDDDDYHPEWSKEGKSCDTVLSQ